MNSYLFYRKIHRLLVLVMVFSVSLMTFTGVILKYPKITNIIPLNLAFIRNLHSAASPFFAIVLLLMMISGVVMYFFPIMAARKKTQ